MRLNKTTIIIIAFLIISLIIFFNFKRIVEFISISGKDKDKNGDGGKDKNSGADKNDNETGGNKENVVPPKNAIGKRVCPLGKSFNIRSQNYVNNGFINNIIKENATGCWLVKDVVKGRDGYFWYKIDTYGAIAGHRYGYVRSDVAKVKKS